MSRADGQPYALWKKDERICDNCDDRYLGFGRLCPTCYRSDPDRSTFSLRRQGAQVGSENLRSPPDEGRIQLEDGSRKRGFTVPDDDQDDRQSDDYGQGDSLPIEISDDDEEDDDGLGASSGEEEPEEGSEEDWQGIADFLGADLVAKLRNKNE